MFSGGIEVENWLKMDYSYFWRNNVPNQHLKSKIETRNED